jgi:hypothetical protein
LFCALPANKWIEQAENDQYRNAFQHVLVRKRICILFADNYVWKIILADQMPKAISKGISIPGFKLEANASKSNLFRFE